MRLLAHALIGCLGVGLLAQTIVVDDDTVDTWWSLRPLQTTSVRVSSELNKSPIRTPVDAFICAKLAEKGLTLSPEADRRTLVRRLFFDLTGLPPTPEDIESFVNDQFSDAYERLVDRLLASPAYGERWARHWMDVVHFAETHGHDQDRIRPHAWHYRDYLVRAFNADTPYARFIEEQLAADVLFPTEPALVAALGLLAAGPWDESSLRDIREDSIDRQFGYYLDRDDMVTTVASTFIGMTVHCARCHDHKFDPISQEDYYRLQAVFADVGRGNVEYDKDVTIGRQRRELRETLAAIDRNAEEIRTRVNSEDFRRELAVWESKHTADAVRWVPLETVQATSANGATLKTLPDNSIRSEGMRPDRDSYTIVVRAGIRNLTAVRLEVLADESLPKGGPGRQDNGNMHLSEFRIEDANGKQIELQAPLSDYDQPGWTIRHATDGDVSTAWGIYPQVGRSHQAVFPLKQPVAGGDEAHLIIKLVQLHGGGHLLGRFRLTATAAAPPAHVPALPERVTEALATPPNERSSTQWEQLGRHLLREKTLADLAALPAPTIVYAVGRDFLPDAGHKPMREPRPVHVLKRGDIRRPGRKASPGALTCVEQLAADFADRPKAPEGERRAALARWIISRDNPLTWRSIVNRVWYSHFGRGIVDTPNDFGRMGGAPSHPELLDWLAIWFRDEAQGSLKKLHRLLVTSAVYRQSSHLSKSPPAGPDPQSVDVDNRLLWRMSRMRLDAEQIRDAILLTSDRLDRKMGGPSDQQFLMRQGLHVTPVIEYGKFDWHRSPGHRRSVYRFIFRTLPDPFMDCLDGADASQLTPQRNVSVTAPQALSLFNNDFVLAQSEAFALILTKQQTDDPMRIDTACRRVWGRSPTSRELTDMESHVKRHGLASLCRVLVNSNEFLFVD